MSYADYQAVILPKVHGAWNIHNSLLAAGASPSYFILLSSAAGILGSRGQAAYAAANTFLDALSQHRAMHGLPATSLDLAAVTDGGYIAEHATHSNAIQRNFGDITMNEAEVLALLSVAVRGATHSIPPQILTGLRVRPDARGQLPYWASDQRFNALQASTVATQLPAKPEVGFKFRAAQSDVEACKIARSGVVAKLAEVLGLEVREVEAAAKGSLASFGLDSLTAIELRN